MDDKRKQKKIVTGAVVSRSGDKSIKVVLNYRVRHPVYGKYMNRRTKLSVHDEKNEATVGDVVEVVECRPISKTKSWRMLKVVQKGVEKEMQQ
jgi:small subunit ribosomal protein S17